MGERWERVFQHVACVYSSSGVHGGGPLLTHNSHVVNASTCRPLVLYPLTHSVEGKDLR
jgi:hypothetical protein